MPTAPAIIPRELRAAFAGPVVSMVTTRLASATEGAAAKSPANAWGLGTSPSAEKPATRVPPAKTFNATAMTCTGTD